MNASTARTSYSSLAIPNSKATEMPNATGTLVDQALPSSSDNQQPSAPGTHQDSDMDHLPTPAKSRYIFDDSEDHKRMDTWRTVDTPAKTRAFIVPGSDKSAVTMKAQPASQSLDSHREGHAESEVHLEGERNRDDQTSTYMVRILQIRTCLHNNQICTPHAKVVIEQDYSSKKSFKKTSAFQIVLVQWFWLPFEPSAVAKQSILGGTPATPPESTNDAESGNQGLA